MKFQNNNFEIELNSLDISHTYAGCMIGSIQSFNQTVLHILLTGKFSFDEIKLPTSSFWSEHGFHKIFNMLPNDWDITKSLPKIQWKACLESQNMTTNENGCRCGSVLYLIGFSDNMEEVFMDVEEHLEKLDWNEYATNFDY